MSYDPETDNAGSMNRAKVRAAYETLRRRGEDERAEALREAESLDEQLTLADRVREYEPDHDPATSSAKLGIKRTYDALVAAGHDERAAELASIGTVAEQHQRASDLAAEYDLEVRP
jgi:hypothetical protein